MSPLGPYYAGTVTDSGATPNVRAWTSPDNAKAFDSVTADFPYSQGVTVNFASNSLLLTNYNFNLPSTAIIDGIKIIVTQSGIQVTSTAQLLKAGAPVGASRSIGAATTLASYASGGATDLWSTTWTVSEINATGFGVQLDSTETHDPADSSYHVDAVGIIIYWHTAPAEVAKRYLYKSFNSAGTYLGNIPYVDSRFEFSQDINAAGAQISVHSAISIDTASLLPDDITDESGNILTNEDGDTLTNEGQLPIVAAGNAGYDALIKNGNRVEVWEYSYYYPNGKCMFKGEIERWEADYGGDDSEGVTLTVYSDGKDMDNYLVRGNPYTYTGDISQATQDARVAILNTGLGWDFYGQTWRAGVTNLGAISIMLDGTADVTISVYDSPALATLLGSVSQSISVVGPTEVQFALPNTITTTIAQNYFFSVTVGSSQSIWLHYSDANPYVNGAMYNSAFGGGGGGSWGAFPANSDLYFKTFSGTGSTTGSFTNQDPTTGILETILTDYIARGGLISYGSTTVDATGLSLSYGFNTNTIYDALGSILSLSPDGFYYYVDLGTNTLYFRQANTVADIVLTKGRHLDKIKIAATIEYLRNQIFFSGGDNGSGSNIYVMDQDADSISNYGLRLDRLSDNRVANTTTAHAVTSSDLAEKKDEHYLTSVSIVDRTMDITLLKPGLVIGFNGFGTFVDNLIAEVVHIDYSPEAVNITLGILPKRLHIALEKATRGLVALQTIDNPTAPS